jgi:hypothetical protein
MRQMEATLFHTPPNFIPDTPLIVGTLDLGPASCDTTPLGSAPVTGTLAMQITSH